MVYVCLCGGGGRAGNVACPSPGEPENIASAVERIYNLQSSTLTTQAFSTVPYSGDQVLRCVSSKDMRVRRSGLPRGQWSGGHLQRSII